ncbi:hypothetical protein ACXR2U_20200 [Jatrophihabitans sp. YIM 134969]
MNEEVAVIVDCERCPGQHLSPPACPSCVVRLLLDTAPHQDGAQPPPDLAFPSEARPVEVALVPRTDDLGRELDTREQRAVAVLTAAGLLPGTGGRGGGRRRSSGSRRQFRTA